MEGGLMADETALAPLSDEQAVGRKLSEVRTADYFTILELDADGAIPQGAVGASYERLCRRFDPNRFVGRAGPELEEQLMEIRGGLDIRRGRVECRVVTKARSRASECDDVVGASDNTGVVASLVCIKLARVAPQACTLLDGDGATP